jgi:carbon monoxide dehydrogenase subunit G
VGIVAAIRSVCAGRQPAAAVAARRPDAASVPISQQTTLPHTASVQTPRPAAPIGAAPLEGAGGGRPSLTERITLTASPDTVWAALGDLRSVASCLPGAEITAVDGEAVTGRLRVALGPIRAGFAGQGTVTRDDATRSGRLRGRGRDTGTGSSVEGEARYVVRPAGAGTELEVSLSWRLTGSLAQFARGELVQVLARRLMGDFTVNLEALIQGKAPVVARPLGLFGVLWVVVRGWLFGR